MMSLTVKELREKAKEMGLKGYSNLRKESLVAMIEAEVKKAEEPKVVSVEDMIIDHIDEMEREFPNKDNVAEIVTNGIMDYSGKWMELHPADKFDYLYDLLWDDEKEKEKEKEKEIEFKPELTAISVNNSYSAKIVAEKVAITDRVLDYGCGTGRNIEYISKNSVCSSVDGTDIVPQLEKEKIKHNKLRELGHTIEASKFIKNSHYDYVLNSHVLNVIADDEIKQVVVEDIYKKLKKGGSAIIEVRTKSDVESAKTKEKYKDGWKIKKGSSFTYQEAITKEKMADMLTRVGFKIKEHIYNSSRHLVVACK